MRRWLRRLRFRKALRGLHEAGHEIGLVWHTCRFSNPASRATCPACVMLAQDQHREMLRRAEEQQISLRWFLDRYEEVDGDDPE